MRRVLVPEADSVIEVNALVCLKGGNPHHCRDQGMVESALHTAFFPGSDPYIHGDVPGLAAALCYYLVRSHAFVDGNKRTGALTAIVFLNFNGFDLAYEETPTNELASIIEACAASRLSKEDLITWFRAHAVVTDATGMDDK